MSITMAERVREQAVSETEDLQREAIEFLTGQGGSAPLHDVLKHLRARSAADDMISRALAGLITAGRLHLTSQRALVLADR